MHCIQERLRFDSFALKEELSVDIPDQIPKKSVNISYSQIHLSIHPTPLKNYTIDTHILLCNMNIRHHSLSFMGTVIKYGRN